MEGRGPPLDPLLATTSPPMVTCYLFTFTRNSRINRNYLSQILGVLHSYLQLLFCTCFLFCFIQTPGGSLSPKLSAFHTLSHTELSDNSPQPSGTIMVLKKCGNRSCLSWDEFVFFFFPLPPLKGAGGGVFLPLPVT